MIDSKLAELNQKQLPSKPQQWLWFVGLYVGSIVTIGTLSYIVKFFLR